MKQSVTIYRVSKWYSKRFIVCSFDSPSDPVQPMVTVCTSCNKLPNGVVIEKPIVVDRLKTMVALFLLFVAWLANDIALAWIHERVPYESEPLPDIWFSIFPEYTPAIKITELLIFLSLFFAFTVVLLHQHRWIIFRRIFFIAALCYFGRSICISVTQVPVPSRNTYCGPRANETSLYLVAKRVAWTFSGFGLDMYHKRVLCGDLIYSGHTTVLMLGYLIVRQYLPDKWVWLSYFSKAVAYAGMICILMARKHYTLDVIIAYWIATRIFWMYHSLADTKRADTKNSLFELYWYPIFLFMESDVPPNLPNRLNCICCHKLKSLRRKFSMGIKNEIQKNKKTEMTKDNLFLA